MGIPDHLTPLLRNPNVGQEAPVRTRHGTMDWFQIGKGVCPQLLNNTLILQSNRHRNRTDGKGTSKHK